MLNVSICFSKSLNVNLLTKLRCLSTKKLAQDVFKYTEKPETSVNDPEPHRNLALVLFWLGAKPNHIEKYCSIYTKNNFDVLAVTTPPMNCLLPKRSQKTARNVVKFLENNESYDRVLIHGFSVGGYLWGECLIRLHENKTFDKISSRIKGQVWDSVAVPKSAPIGVANAVFQNQKFMEMLLIKSIDTYFNVFYESTMKHLVEGFKYFKENPINAPMLVFGSKTDPIGPEELLRSFVDFSKRQNIDSTLKIFDDSPHVQHYQKHKEEYLQLLMEHLKKCQLIQRK